MKTLSLLNEQYKIDGYLDIGPLLHLVIAVYCFVLLRTGTAGKGGLVAKILR